MWLSPTQFETPRQRLPDENFGRHNQVGKTAYTVVDKIQDSENEKLNKIVDFENFWCFKKSVTIMQQI